MNGLPASAADLNALDGITFAYELDGGWGLEGLLIVAGVQLDFRQRHSGGGVVDGGFNGADRRIQCGLCKLALKNFPDFLRQIHRFSRRYRGWRGLGIGRSRRVFAMPHKLRRGSGIQIAAKRGKSCVRPNLNFRLAAGVP